jgi:predicted component of type VI protein secretion system
MPKLIFTQTKFAAEPCELPEGTTTVGRSPRNNLVILDKSVSAEHCEILVSWNEVIVRELGSTNGTWVAGVRVNGQRPVNHGEIIRFGEVEARLELLEPATEDTSDTIVHLLVDHAAQPEPASPPLHAVIQPISNRPEPSADSDVTMTFARPSPPAAPVATEVIQPARPAASRSGGGPLRRWLAIGIVAGTALAAVWLWWS